MKKYILGTSLGSSGLATLSGLYGVVGNSDKAVFFALCFGLFGIASFFVGLAYPVAVVDTQTFDNETKTTTNVRKYN